MRAEHRRTRVHYCKTATNWIWSESCAEGKVVSRRIYTRTTQLICTRRLMWHSMCFLMFNTNCVNSPNGMMCARCACACPYPWSLLCYYCVSLLFIIVGVLLVLIQGQSIPSPPAIFSRSASAQFSPLIKWIHFSFFSFFSLRTFRTIHQLNFEETHDVNETKKSCGAN